MEGNKLQRTRWWKSLRKFDPNYGDEGIMEWDDIQLDKKYGGFGETYNNETIFKKTRKYKAKYHR